MATTHGRGPADPQSLAAALVAALAQALLAAERLRGALESGASGPADAATPPAPVRALAGCCSALPRRAPAGSTPDEARALLEPPVTQPARSAVAPPAAPPALPAAAPPGLSRREAEVLGLLAAGRSTGQIAQALCLSPRTVQRHVANLYLKIGAHSRAEAVAYALRHGLA